MILEGGQMNIVRSLPGLTSLEKKSIFLVLLGTFLEFFDFVLYVHFAGVLNHLMFPKAGPLSTGVLAAFAFSLAFFLRPVGAFVFGYVGDKVGRKVSIVWTAGLMGFASLLIGLLPPYETIGIAAPILFLIARGLQGFSSIGEMISAQIFLVEVGEKSRAINLVSTFMYVSLILGVIAALGSGAVFLHLDPENGWRWPFLLGSVVAITGAVIRFKALESPAFLAVGQRKEESTTQELLHFFRLFSVWRKKYWLYFGIELITPLSIYFTMRHCSDLLHDLGVGYTQVFVRNLVINVIYLFAVLFYGWLSLNHNPLTILRRRLLTGTLLLPLVLGGMFFSLNGLSIFVAQAVVLVFLCGSAVPAHAVIIRSFPIIGRCTNIGSAYAISHAMMYIVSAFFILFLDNVFGLWGVGALIITTAWVSFYCAYRFTPEETTSSSVSFQDNEIRIHSELTRSF